MTFDREKHEKKGRRFMSEHNCYVHIEAKDGHMRSSVSGDTFAIISSIYELLYRLSKESNVPLPRMLFIIRSMYDEEVRHKHGTD